MQRTKIMKVNPTNPQLDCRIRTQRRRAYKAEHQQLLKSLFLRNICKISCALCSGTGKHVLFPFHYLSVLQLGRADGQYNQASYRHSQGSRRLWTSHLLYPPSLTIQSHWSWFLTLHPGCSKAGSRARKGNKQNGFWICKSSNNVCWLMHCI